MESTQRPRGPKNTRDKHVPIQPPLEEAPLNQSYYSIAHAKAMTALNLSRAFLPPPRYRFSWYVSPKTHPRDYVTHHSSQHLTPSMLHSLSPMTPSNTCAHDPTCASFPHALQLECSHTPLHSHLPHSILTSRSSYPLTPILVHT